jgi:lipopolysaccharide export system permease protein
MKLRELMRELKKPGISDKQLREFAMELHKKFAIPFSCLVFGILGLPLGIGQHRSGKSRGFTIGLVVVTIYYVLQLTGDALGENGTVPPVVGTWAPNVILGIIGIYLLIRAAQEKPQEFTFVTRFAHNIRNSIKALFRRT